ncbi:TIGR02710 family CRISPR-associated protein [bacterium]|nr:TIGR02710 family CRISPR-associated protein [bacterium]
MSNSVLLLTVGGSPDPLLTCVKELRPERVVFFASELTRKCVDGPGKPNERRRGGEVEKLESLVQLMKLAYDPGQDLVELEDIDDFQACYQQILNKVWQLQAEGHKHIAIDYTGGTKTMSAALLLVAVDEALEIHITTGIRDNTRAVQRGQATRGVGVTDLRTGRTLHREVERALGRFDYGAAEKWLHQLVRPKDLSKALRDRVQFLRSVCQSLAAWDVFDHIQALECVEGSRFSRSPQVRDRLLKPLKRLVQVRAWLDQGGPLPPQTCGYELVQDLVLNAQRCARRGRYDDAVGRIYRALEMLAQIRLKLQYGIETGQVKAEQVPEAQRSHFLQPGQTVCQLGLLKAYELLQHLQDGSVGALYAQQAKVLLNALKTRNTSLFAHGYQPIGEQEYEVFWGFAGAFLEELLERLFGKCDRISQLLSSLEAIGE